METYQTERRRSYKEELKQNQEPLSEIATDGASPLSEKQQSIVAARMSGGMTADLEEVARRTFRTSGKGIVTNALAVGLGFMVLVFSKFIILRYIGILVAVVMFTSSMLSMTIIPGLLNVFDPKFMWSKEEREAYNAKIAEDK
ncbi:MAG: MMPL family transporter [Treponema sp.]|nr:MMPL family transporter [Treponema sp.]